MSTQEKPMWEVIDKMNEEFSDLQDENEKLKKRNKKLKKQNKKLKELKDELMVYFDFISNGGATEGDVDPDTLQLWWEQFIDENEYDKEKFICALTPAYRS